MTGDPGLGRAERGHRVALEAARALCALLIIGSTMGRWSLMAWTAGVFVAAEAVRTGMTRWVAPRLSSPLSLRMGLSLGTFLVLGALHRWTGPVWFLVPLAAVVLEDRGEDAAVALGAYLATVVTLPLTAGVAWTTAGTYALLLALVAWVTRARKRVVELQAEELAEVRQRLAAMETRALEQEKLCALGMLAAGVAHELNNPMSYVTSNVNGLASELEAMGELPPALAEFRDEILPETVDGVRRVNGIVAELRRFARREAEEPQLFDLNAELRAALRLASSALRPRCAVKTELGELPAVEGRPQQLAQVALNLLVNAAQAIPAQGTVTLRSWREGRGVAFSVSDDGVGLSPEARRRLFEPFFTTKPPGLGTGLGLVTVRNIVEAHGGEVTVDSTAGRGTTFTIRLPVEPANAPYAAAADEITQPTNVLALRRALKSA